jgi:hypothetical protein
VTATDECGTAEPDRLFGIDLGERFERDLPIIREPAVLLVAPPEKRPVRTLTDRLAEAAAVRNGTSRPTSINDPPEQDRLEGH